MANDVAIKKKDNNLHISKKLDIALNIIMIILVIMSVLPIILVLSVSLTDEKTLSTVGYGLIPAKFSFKAYTYVFSDVNTILKAYGLTIVLTIIGSILSILTISAYAFPISRKDFRYRNQFSFIVFFTMLFNGGLVPFYMVYVNMLHIKDTVFIYILPWLMQPLYVLIMRTFFSTTIPDELIEAAKIDGAGELRIFFQIALPLAKPSLATIGLFNVLAIWNDWYNPLLFINNRDLYNLQYLMYQVQNDMQFLSQNASSISNASQLMANLPAQSARMAMAIIAIGPIILAYPFFQQYFVEGLTVGAVKG